MSLRVAILTHGDIDGMVSAILVMQSLPGIDPTIKFTNHVHLHRDLRGLADTVASPDEVFVTDVSLATSYGDLVVASLRALDSKGVAVHLYDHHLGWDDWPEAARLCTTYCVDTSKRTAAQLVWHNRCRGTAGSRRWLQLIAEKGGSGDPGIRERFGLLAALMQPQHYDHQGATLRSLARDEELSQEQRELSAWYYDTHVPHVQALADRAEVVTTSSGRKIGWLDLRGEEGRPLVAPHVVGRLGVEVVVTIGDKTITVGGRSIDAGPDLSALHGEHEVDGVRLRVAGHSSPVRIDPVGGGGMTDQFVAAARVLLVDRL